MDLGVHNEVILTGNLFLKFHQPEEREWPTLDEVHQVILSQRIMSYDTLIMFQRIWLGIAESENWSKYERRMLALVLVEFHFMLDILGIPFVQSVLDIVVKKLQESNYDPIYVHFASQLKTK
jgi:hypothetical protein